MCALCRVRAPKSELVRVVWDGVSVAVDPTASRPGRGAYVGPWRSCWADGGLVPKLERALRARFGAADAAYLREQAVAMIDDGGACPRRAARTVQGQR